MDLSTVLTGEPTYWPSDNKKILGLPDFDIIKGISKNYCHIQFYFELSLNYSPIIITVNSKVMIKDKLTCIFYNAKTNRSYFRKLLMIILDNYIPLKSNNDIVVV
jgi:hypothetical protein